MLMMLLLARIAGIAVMIWFFLTAKEKGEPAFKWAIIGLIGYWIVWWLVNLTVFSVMKGLIPKSMTMVFIANQIPALCAIFAAFLIRKKLLSDVVDKE